MPGAQPAPYWSTQEPGRKYGLDIDWGGIISGAMPLITGALSTGGQMYTNSQNVEEAQRNRDWQERMSNTSVQRSIEDYKKAGLNPALAYDRTASTPGGAQAVIGNATSAGVSSAMAAKQLQLAQQAAKSEIALKTAQTVKETELASVASTQRELNRIDEGLKRQLFQFNNIVQPQTARLNDVEIALRRLGVEGKGIENQGNRYRLSGLKNEAAFEDMMGAARPGISTARNFLELLRAGLGNQRR